MSAIFGYAITVIPRVYTYYLRLDEYVTLKLTELIKPSPI